MAFLGRPLMSWSCPSRNVLLHAHIFQQPAARVPLFTPLCFRSFASKKTIERKTQNQKLSKPLTPKLTPQPHPSNQRPPTSPSQPSPTTTSKPTTRPPPSTTLAYATQQSAYYQTLAARPSSTPLYISTASTALPLTALAVSAFCTAYASYHLYTTFLLPQPPGLWWGIPYAFAGVSALMLALAAWTAGSARAHIARIDAVPAHLLPAAAAARLRAQAHPTQLVLAVTRKSLLPRARTVYVAPQRCELGGRLAAAQASAANAPVHDRLVVVDGQRRRVSAQELRRLEAERERESMGNPFAHVAGRVSRGLGGFGRIVTREGLVPFVTGKGEGWRGEKRWKIDVSEGSWVGDGGMERLVKVRE